MLTWDVGGRQLVIDGRTIVIHVRSDPCGDTMLQTRTSSSGSSMPAMRRDGRNLASNFGDSSIFFAKMIQGLKSWLFWQQTSLGFVIEIPTPWWKLFVWRLGIHEFHVDFHQNLKYPWMIFGSDGTMDGDVHAGLQIASFFFGKHYQRFDDINQPPPQSFPSIFKSIFNSKSLYTYD